MHSLTILISLLPLALSTKAPGSSPGDLQISYTLTHSCLRPTRDGDTISAHYRGTLLSSGTEFDSSYSRKDPLKFPLGAGRVIKGWDLGLLDMCPGDKRVLTIPPELGYGSRAVGPIPAGSTLVFETELVGIEGVPKEERVLKKVADKAADAAAAVSGKVGDAATAAGESAASATSVVGEKAGEAASVAGESVSSATSVVGEKASDAASVAGESASSVSSVVGEKASDAAAAAGEKVSEATESVKSGAEKAASVVKGAASGAASGAAEGVKEEL